MRSSDECVQRNRFFALLGTVSCCVEKFLLRPACYATAEFAALRMRPDVTNAGLQDLTPCFACDQDPGSCDPGLQDAMSEGGADHSAPESAVYSASVITVAETLPFRRKAETLLTTEERESLIAYLAEHPAAGVIIQGTGGIRKLRWAAEGRGKRGGVRVIYFVGGQEMPLYLLALFAKNEKADLSMTERRQLRILVDQLKAHWSNRHGKRFH